MLYMTTEQVAQLEQLARQTVVRRCARERYRGVTGGGMGTPYRILISAYEKQRHLEPGTVEKKIRELKAQEAKQL